MICVVKLNFFALAAVPRAASMIDIQTIFPQCTHEKREAFEDVPRTLAKVRAAINFRDALPLNDPRYVDTKLARDDRFERDFYRMLGYDREAGTFDPPESSRTMLFFGHVGCGKSTELVRMSDTLHASDRYWVVQVNLLDRIDPHDARYSDIWLAVVEAFVGQLSRERIDIPGIVVNRFKNWFTERVLANDSIREYAAEIKAEAGVEGGIPLIAKYLAKFTSSIKTGSSYRESLRTVVQNTYGEFVDALSQLILAATQQVQKVGKGQRILFAVEGTDRLKGDDWKRLFVDEANQLTMVDAIVVYTAPMALLTSGQRLDLFETQVLPMVKLRDFDTAKRREVAYSAMREMLLKRCHYSLFENAVALDRLIDYSGGHMRDALRLLAYASVAADGPTVDANVVDTAAMRLARDYRNGLSSEDYAVLQRVAQQPENEGRDEVITRLVEFGALLEYNTGSWRKPHPVVTLLPGYHAASSVAGAVE
jgi:hypothetical protein